MDYIWILLLFLVLTSVFWCLLSMFAFTTEMRCSQEQLDQLLPDIERELHLASGSYGRTYLNREQRCHLAKLLASARSEMKNLDSVHREHYALRLTDLSYLAESVGVENQTTVF
ncbi:hypothetical protein SAMN02745866_01579 [Alteromonadaceae bacterium Bs31]|nr:hypothetical protein SAMN02745866_01579 [Alteromonadaceae bacterium Bs31]